MDCNIFVTHHKPAWSCENEVYRPIQAGRALSTEKLPMLGDDTGDNISAKNPTWCELTAHYWVWRNWEPTDFIGFCHYKRYFSFSPSYQQSEQAVPAEEHIVCNAPDALVEVDSHHIILTEPLQLSGSIAQQYAVCHRWEDFQAMLQVITELSPEYVPFVTPALFQNDQLVLANMFIAPWEVFDEYMSWLFAILNEVETRISISDDPYQARVFGFLAERMLNLFFFKKAQSGNPLWVVPWIVL